MFYSPFIDQQPQTSEEGQCTIHKLGRNPVAYGVEIYPPDDGQKDRTQYYGWIALIWDDGGESIATCAIPENDLLIDALRGPGIKEVEIATSIGSE